MSRQELRSTGGNCQGDDRQESCSSAGNCQAGGPGRTQDSRQIPRLPGRVSPGTAGFISFKELDARWATPKGTAFRAFKRALTGLRETDDFIRLDALRDRDEIQRLRA